MAHALVHPDSGEALRGDIDVATGMPGRPMDDTLASLTEVLAGSDARTLGRVS